MLGLGNDFKTLLSYRPPGWYWVSLLENRISKNY